MGANDQPDTPAPLLREPEGGAEDEVVRLRGELATTARVVAVLTERLLDATGGTAITITDEALKHAPDLDARRNPARFAVLLRTSRE